MNTNDIDIYINICHVNCEFPGKKMIPHSGDSQYINETTLKSLSKSNIKVIVKCIMTYCQLRMVVNMIV